MFGRKKTAWITAAVDEETTVQAIVLAKSLSRVVTTADTIVLISDDLPEHFGSLLSKFFDHVLAVDLHHNTKLSKMETVTIQAWNLSMYDKCVVLHSNKLVVKSSDELFDLNSAISVAILGENGNQTDTSLMVITPELKQYQVITKLSATNKFETLSQVLNVHYGLEKMDKIDLKYNFNIMDMSVKNNALLDINIASLGNKANTYFKNGITSKLESVTTLPAVLTFWMSSWQDVESKLKNSTISLEKNAITTGNEQRGYYKDAIAIVGQSCRFPGANNSAEFWDLLEKGGDGIRSVPLERLFDFQLNDTRFTDSKAGFLKCPIDEFDAKFFGISPREAAFMDPQQRLLVEVAWEALENAAINPHSLKGSNTGVFTGIWTHDYERLITENTSGQDFHHVILGNAFSATSARVSFFLGLNGPNVATESGCSSSMVALHLACDSLRKRESNLGLVLGANIIVVQFPLTEVPILAKDGHCKTFDEGADGFGRAEGVAVIVLKRLPDALKQGDRILGVIRSTAISNEGTSSNFGTPSKLCQEIAIKDALANAGLKPGDVDYVEAHGTGTPIGDPIEFAAISAGYTGERDKPLVIGSVKTNTGHTESAAGLAGLIKVLLSMEHEIIPPHINFTTLNPSINLDTVPAIIPVESQQWSRNPERVRIAGVSSFGISGTNVHVIVEEPPPSEVTQSLETGLMKTETPLHLITLSAKSENALKDLSNNYIKYLIDNPDVNIGDLAYTCNTGRAHLKYRLAISGATVGDFQKALEDVYTPPVLNEKPKIAFLFTGQGSQYFGMAKSLFQSNFEFRNAINECENIIENHLGVSIKAALWSEASQNLLDQTVFSQLSIFAVEYGLLKLWESLGVIPDCVLGHSVGEFAAATAAGIVDLRDALILLAERSRLIQSLPAGGMVAIRTSKDKVSQLITEFLNTHNDMWLDIAVINSADEVVVAGNKDSLEAFTDFCGNNGTKFQTLAAAQAFHSREMDCITQSFEEFAKQIDYRPSKYQYVSGTSGCLLEEKGMENGKYWAKHAREAVNFQKGMTTLGEFGCNVFIEIGAHPVLLALGMINLNCPGTNLWLPSLRRSKDDWETLFGSLSSLFTNGGTVDWKYLDKGWARKKLELPTYPFQRQKYWIDFSTEGLERSIHPLLGKKVMLADVSESVYEHKWNLNELQYIKDHQVAHTIVLPGAGFLEIILAAGKDILLKNRDDENSILTVKDFVVEAPFQLEEGKRYKTQVVATPVKNELFTLHVNVYLYRKLNGYNDDKGWKRYSSAYVMLKESVSWPVDENQNAVFKGKKTEMKDKSEKVATNEVDKVVEETELETNVELKIKDDKIDTTGEIKRKKKMETGSETGITEKDVTTNREKEIKEPKCVAIKAEKEEELPEISSEEILETEKKAEQKYTIEDIEAIKSRCPVEKESSEFYKLAPEIGIFFGEAFQSIETAWGGVNEALASIPMPVNAGNIKDYVYHPIILDAMIQLFGLSIGQENVDLYLPVGVDYVFMVNDCLSECVYAHAKWTEGTAVGTVALYSEKNVLLALMVGVRLLRTSVSSFMNVISAHQNMLPGMYHEIWRQRVGPVQARIDVGQITETDLCIEPLHQVMEKHMHMFDLDCQSCADEAVCLGVMRIFTANDIFPKVGHVYRVDEMVQEHVIHSAHLMLLKRFIEILCEDGYGAAQYENGVLEAWECIKEFPSLEDNEKRAKEIDDFVYVEGCSVGRTCTADILHKCIDHMWDVITGKQTPVSALFGREDMNPLDIYTKTNECIVASMRSANYLGLALKKFKSDGKQEDNIIRIIEIGAGSAATTKEILAVLQKEEIPFRYTFTDISPHFFEGAKEQFLGIGGIDYKVLDIEKDPSTQGFCPNYFDVVVAANVIHATENLRASLANIRKLIGLNGILLLQEIIQPNRAIDTIFGILEGYWKFTDFDIRPRHSMVSTATWSKVMLETGFTEATNMSSKDEFIAALVSRAVDHKPLQFSKTSDILETNSENISKPSAWVIAAEEGNLSKNLEYKFSSLCDKVLIIKREQERLKTDDLENTSYVDLSNEEEMTNAIQNYTEKYDVKGVLYLATVIGENNNEVVHRSLLSVCKYLSEKSHNNLQFIAITKGVYCIQNQKFVNPLNAIIWGMAKSLANESPKMQGKMIDLDPDDSNSLVESEQIFFEVFDKEEVLVCFRKLKKYVSRYTKLPKPLAPLTIPKGRYRIDIPKSKKINDVSFMSIEKETLGPKSVEVIVKAVALNFRDIFVILKPEMYTTIKETVGTDFSGIVSDIGTEVTKFNIGDEVYGVTHTSAVGSHAVTHEDVIMLKPKEGTFTDAATVPSVLLTSYHCLMSVANLKKDETILIHVASGGVGLVAIQMAKYVGAKVIATAGSHRKRNYLRSLGIKHVFHSRDLTFGDEIARVTNGRGVDMVLNSLTGNGFKETSLKACAENARFVEMGKVNVWKSEEVYELRPDVQYFLVDLEKLSEREMGEMLEEMKKNFRRDEDYKSLPYSKFDVVNIRDALNYFLKAKHIGKVVVTMPDVTEFGNQVIKKDAVFNRNATYLVTGGLGGIGLEVAKWMTDSGCKNLILIGRTAPSDSVVQVLNTLRAKGCKILTFQVDVGNWDQLKSLFETISSIEYRLPPLRGVIHSAGVISDAIYMNQTWEKYQSVFNAKLNGCMNLHNLTKDLNLEHFVLFSSMAGIFGPMGQSNHAAANAFLDSFAQYRYSMGLPAQSINWGGWSEVGAASNTVFGKEGLFGVKPFTPGQGIATLKFIMNRPDLLQVGVIQVELNELKQFVSLGNVLSELVDDTETTDNTPSSAQSEKFWAEISPLSLDERVIYIKAKLTALIRQTLKLPDSETIDEFQTFQEMGLDSLMAVEMKNKLQNIVGKKITLNVAAIMDNPTINSLSKYVAEQTMTVEFESEMPGGGTKTVDNQEVDSNALTVLVEKDSLLQEEIRALDSITVKASEMMNILITGSTGHLGCHLLKELAQNDKLNICCVIRGKTAEQSRRKLVANLKKHDLFNHINVDRISTINGDITDENFGLPREEYNKLAAKTEIILHLAARANYADKYQVNKMNKADVRSVNVFGTLNVLKFACTTKTKRVFYASSFACINRYTEDGFIYEDFPDNENMGDELALGYPLSKLVCEKLLRQANERGIPCTVVRYSSLIGNSETGRFTVDTNSTMNSYMMSLKFGMIPDVKDCWYSIPVDIASKLTVDVIFHNEINGGVFNIVQPTPTYIPDMVVIAKQFGYNLTLVSVEEYEARVKEETEKNSFLTIFTDSYGKGTSYAELNKSHPVLGASEERPIVNRISDKCKQLLPGISERIPTIQSIFHVYMEFGNSSSIFERYGITPFSSQ